jgi:hypothetical protein
MRAGVWDWNRPGTALRVLDVDGQLVSFDNRRLDAARKIVDPVRIQRLSPYDPYPASSTGKTWEQAFKERRNDKRNRPDGGPVPESGTPNRLVMRP